MITFIDGIFNTTLPNGAVYAVAAVSVLVTIALYLLRSIGLFVMAKRAACPLVICKIEGTNAYHGRFPFRRTDTVFTVLEVIPPERVKELKPEELAEYSRGVIASAL